jgi:hypothetical protein
MQLSVHLGVRWTVIRLAVPPASGSVGADQVKAEAVAVATGEDDIADIARDWRRELVKRVGEAPATGLFVEVLDLVSNSADPIPAERLYLPKPGSAKPSVRDQDGFAVLGQDQLEAMQELAVSAGAVVALEGKYPGIDSCRTPTDRPGCLQHRPLAASATFEIRPVHGEHGPAHAGEQRPGERPVDLCAFAVQVPVAEQPIDGFDVMLDVRAACAVSAELTQRRLAAENERLDYSDERRRPHRVRDDRPLLQPSC